jgi:hypothetical protein
VTGLALRHALSTKYAGNTVDGFKKFVQMRQQQVTMGCPLKNLSIGIVPGDVSISAVGIHAERLTFAREEVWQPVPDTNPNGPHFSIIETGRAIVEMQNQRKVMTLTTGSVLVDVIASSYGATIRATSKICEVYRLRQFDFKLATAAVPCKWLWRFNLLEKECRNELLSRLQNMNGLIEGLAQHPRQDEINAWRNNRMENIRLASQRREAGDRNSKLPRIMQKSASETSTTLADPVDHEALKEQIADETHAFLSVIAKKRESSGRASLLDTSNKKGEVGFGSGLLAYPSFHLPMISAKGGKSTLQSSQSETTLRSSLSETASRSS